MQLKQELDSTVNSSLYKKLYKRFISHKFGYCDFCGFNRGENANHSLKRYKKSWKKNSKRLRQYKIRNIESAER